MRFYFSLTVVVIFFFSSFLFIFYLNNDRYLKKENYVATQSKVMTISRESAWLRYVLDKKDKTQTQSPLKGTFAYGDRYMKYTVTALALCLKMADRPKRMSRAPKRFVDDSDEMGPANVGRVGKRRKRDKNLYEVNIVDVNNE